MTEPEKLNLLAELWGSQNLPHTSGTYPNLHPSSYPTETLPSGLLIPSPSLKANLYQPDSWTDVRLISSWSALTGLSTFATGSSVANTSWPLIPDFSHSLFRTEPLPVSQREMPVIGFRAWEMQTGSVLLHSLGVVSHWVPGTNDFECHCSLYHDQPHERCHCGFYVCSEIGGVPPTTKAYWASHQVVGAVMGWGRVIQHGDEGWRAEHVRVLALEERPGKKKRVARIASHYGVPVLERDALLMMVKEYGDRLPQEAAG
jgi:hypothetical protein